MKEDYAFKYEGIDANLKLEKEVAEALQKMSDYTKIPVSEMANTAIKRFIATHSDFFPPRKK